METIAQEIQLETPPPSVEERLNPADALANVDEAAKSRVPVIVDTAPIREWHVSDAETNKLREMGTERQLRTTAQAQSRQKRRECYSELSGVKMDVPHVLEMEAALDDGSWGVRLNPAQPANPLVGQIEYRGVTVNGQRIAHQDEQDGPP